MALSKSVLAGLSRVLGAHAGLELPAWVIESRAEQRAAELALDGERYLALLETPKGAAERRELVEAVRVGETRFFRHQPQVDALLEVVVPTWKARNIARPRILSAGCASGEEPYTLALVLARALPSAAFSILATDVSAEAIETAKRGTYPASALDQVPEPYREGLVRDANGRTIRVHRNVAKQVAFECQNLATAEIQRGYDLVWCRNVLIYFEPSARRRVLHRLVEALSPDGFLFLGYSETLRGVAGLSPVRHGDQILWQKARRPHSKPPPKPITRNPPSRSPDLPVHSSASSVSVELPRTTRTREPKPHSSRRGTVHIAVTDSSALRTDVAKALSHRGLGALTIDLDAAPYLEDDVAPVLRRACAAADAAGIRVVLRAERPGAKRWLRKNGLEGGET